MTQRLIDYSSSEGEEDQRSDDRETLRSATGKRKKDQDKKRDKKLLEEELHRIEREKVEEEYDRWRLKEDEFSKKQLIEQSKIRIENRREEPIDYFMKIIFIYKSELKMDDYITVDLLKHPKKIVDRLNKVETESLLEKCDIYKKLDKNEDFKYFWDDIKVLALHHQERLIKFELKKRGNINIQTVIGEEYNEDVEEILKGKSSKALEELESQAKSILNSADFNVDIEFWEQVMTRLQVQKAVIGLIHIHNKYFECKDDGQSGHRGGSKGGIATGANSGKILARYAESLISDPLSPRLYTGDDFGKSIRILTEDEYKKRLDTIRTKSYQNELAILVKKAENEIELRKMKDIGMIGEDKALAEEEDDDEDTNDEAKRFKEIMKQAENKMDDDEIVFDDMEQTKKVIIFYQTTDWIDKFKPRKPHYFNRVKMGYEWNRVNQAHYDLETPPPKMVLGYKFNLFYPKLLDKSKTPTYELVPADNPEFCIIKFTAGPPYEDISFKIVNREWDLSDRQGFKCIFDRGILHLHFNFKMARYRR